MSKRILAIFAALCMFMCCSSCGIGSSSISDLLLAPRTNGEMHDIQRALHAFAGKAVDLCYPQRGDNRTAFLQSDLDSDGEEEAVAFYTANASDGVQEVHINLIDYIDGEWVSVSDFATGANAIDRVEIATLEKGGSPVLVVGAELYTAMGNQLNFFTYQNNELTVRLQESYTDFLLCDMLGEGYDQLLLLNLRATERAASATLYTVGADTTEVIGTAPLDGNISSFSSVTVGKLSDGRPAVFIDSLKSATSMITDVVYLGGEGLINPFFDQTVLETQSTVRSSTAICEDINGDGVTEIPFTQILPGYDVRPANERMYMTLWRSFDGVKLDTVTAGDYNQADGYYLEFTAAWQGSVTLIYDTENAMRSYRIYDPVMQSTADEILRIRVYTDEEYEGFDNSELIVLSRSGGKVYAARIVTEKGAYAISRNELKQAFRLINVKK